MYYIFSPGFSCLLYSEYHTSGVFFWHASILEVGLGVGGEEGREEGIMYNASPKRMRISSRPEAYPNT